MCRTIFATTRFWPCLTALLVSMLVAGHAGAQERSAAELQGLAQNWLRDAVAASPLPSGVSLRMESFVGAVDPRLKLAPCAQVEPYLPAGSRLWGKSRVGLRCADGVARWNISLPSTVNAWGRAWVVRNQVASGAVLTEADAIEADVNWAEESAAVLKDRSTWVGMVAMRQLGTGQTLRQNLVRPAQVFLAGTQVRVVAQGVGFQVSSDAMALSDGVIGQPARVRMDNGWIASGLVLDVRTVKIEL